MRSAIWAILILFSSLCLSGQDLDVRPYPTAKDTIDITLTDFTKIDGFKAQNARIFGIALGMSIAQVEQVASEDSRIYIMQDKLNGYRRYIYDSCMTDNDSADVIYGYLKWNEGDTGLAEIVLYENIWQAFNWPSCDLFSHEVLEPESLLYKKFFGKPAKKRIELDIPSINLRSTQYIYPAHNMVVTENIDGDEVNYTIAFMKKIE